MTFNGLEAEIKFFFDNLFLKRDRMVHFVAAAVDGFVSLLRCPSGIA